MATFPQLNEEDFQQFNEALNDLLAKSEATTVLIVEKAGYLIHQNGDKDQFDATTVATLASNAYQATKFMTTLINEEHFSVMYQQGDAVSSIIVDVDENCVLVIVFKAELSVGMIKYYATETGRRVAAQLETAQRRDPGKGFDLIDMNATDVAGLFRRKSAEDEPGAAGNGTT
jgi:predicted regulator of Ras-like GTPase activity (Roadblock/LC7/MglB family)